MRCLWIALVTSCNQAAPLAPATTKLAPAPPPPAAATASAWWQRPPIATAVEAGPDACRVDAAAATITLAVAGEPFAHRVAGVTGELVVAPKPGANIRFGAVQFATGVDLAHTEIRLKHRPPRLGGILEVDQSVGFHVVGGDRAALTLEAVAEPYFEWLQLPRITVPCDELGRANWPDRPSAERTIRHVAETAKLDLRATFDGPVIARVTHLLYVIPLETKGTRVEIEAPAYNAAITAWTDAAQLAAAPPAPPAEEDPYGGVVVSPQPHVRCASGTPVLLRRGDQLYTVGALSTPLPDDVDWRFSNGKVWVEAGKLDGGAPYFAIKDSLAVTNSYGANSIDPLLVPQADCTWEVAR